MGVGSGWKELRRGEVRTLDLRLRFMGGVERVRGCPCVRPDALAGDASPEPWWDIPGERRIDCRMAWSSDVDRRPLRSSAKPLGTTAMGRECCEAVRCCMSAAESRRTVSGVAPFLTGPFSMLSRSKSPEPSISVAARSGDGVESDADDGSEASCRSGFVFEDEGDEA